MTLPDSDKLITEKEWVALVEKHGSEEAVVNFSGLKTGVSATPAPQMNEG